MNIVRPPTQYQMKVTELKNRIPELTNILEGFNTRLGEAEKWIIYLKTRHQNASKQSSEKNFKKLR